MQKLNYYEMLGIKPESDSQTIREVINSKIRKMQAQINSPDRNSREAAEKEMASLLKARKVLLKPIKCKEYNKKIQKAYEGELKSTVDAIGKEISVDSLSRPAKITYPDGRVISYAYDQVGNLIKIIDSVMGTTSYQYDLLDRLTKVTYPDGNVLSYAYDAVGNRKSVTYSNGEVIYYNYNPNNWLTEVIAGAKKTRFEYDKVGNLVKRIFPNGTTISYTYNAARRLTNLVVTDAKGSTLFHFSYNFDAIGNCLEIERNSKNSNNRTNYKYDSLYQLAGINHSNGKKIKYRYDAVGNRLSMQVSSPSSSNAILRYLTKTLRNLGILWEKTYYTYDAENYLIKVGDAEFKYDNNGNLAEENIGNKITRYFYTYDNKLVGIEYPDGTYSQYTYDALGRRVYKRTRNGRITRYIYDGHNLIQELDDKGRVIASYIYDLGIDHPISMTRNGKIYYYLYDHIGSVIALADEPGSIVTEYEYDAWGNIIKERGDIENPFRFTGREWDEESGLYYYRARYYDPIVGRFISRDSFTGFVTNPQGLNRYIYVNNNPQTYRDPFGLQPLPSYPRWTIPLGPFSFFHPAVRRAISDTFSYAENYWTALGQNLAAKSMIRPSGYHWGYGLAAEGANLMAAMLGGGQGAQYWQSMALDINPGIGIIRSPVLLVRNLSAGSFLEAAKGALSMALSPAVSYLTSATDILTSKLPNVGGVLFDKAAGVLTDLEEISGTYWDEKLGQLVLVGKKNGKMGELLLPRMDKDHLAVAMRAVFSGDNLGVSIDPPPSYLESGEFPPDGTKMEVKYLGDTKGTLFGAIMFETDKLLKNLSMGTDNDNRKEVSSQVLDFQNELDLSLKYGTEKKSAWHRMWFVIEDMRLDMVVKETADRNALTFGKATLKVKAEYLSKQKDPGVDPIAERFAKHFTLHFDDFAEEFPILERLRELAKISAIVKWLKNSGKPVNLSFLNDYEFIEVPTPEDTPGITTSKSKSWQDGSVTHTQTYSLYGGVDFDFKYQAVRDDGEALSLKKVTQESKPCETALAWDFRLKGKAQRALVLPMTRVNGNFATIHTDFFLSSNDEMRLELTRCYDSFNTKSSIFGYGWILNIPYKLFILNPQKSNSPILLMDRITGKSDKYIFVEDSQAYYLVKEEKEEGGSTSFSYDPQRFIKKNPEGGFTWESEEGFTYNFDPQGRLTSKVDKNKRRLDYIYEDNWLVKISNSFGNDIRLIYDDNNRIKQIIAPAQTIIDYLYDRYGDLIRVSDNKGNIKSYTYDVEHRLIKVQDERGRTILRNSYDPLGRIIKKRQDAVAVDGGNIITRTYGNDYQLIKEENQKGNTVLYEYDQDKNLTRSVMSDMRGRKVIFEHDEEEKIKRITNPVGHSVRFTYDSRGNITSVTNPNGHIKYLEYDNNNNPISLRDAMGNEWRQEFDHLSRPRTFIDPMGNKVELTYNKDNFVNSITTPEGTTRYQYDKKGRLTKLIDPNGKHTEYFMIPHR